MSGQSNDSTAYTGPIKVIVKQDGVGRTGGIVIAAIAALGFGFGVASFVLADSREDRRDADYERNYRELEREYRLGTQAVDELRVEINTDRKLRGLPPINAQEHD